MKPQLTPTSSRFHQRQAKASLDVINHPAQDWDASLLTQTNPSEETGSTTSLSEALTGRLTPAKILHLQRTVGNQAVQRIIAAQRQPASPASKSQAQFKPVTSATTINRQPVSQVQRLEGEFEESLAGMNRGSRAAVSDPAQDQEQYQMVQDMLNRPVNQAMPQVAAAPAKKGFFRRAGDTIASGAKSVGGAIVSGAKSVGGALATGAQALLAAVFGPVYKLAAYLLTPRAERKPLFNDTREKMAMLKKGQQDPFGAGASGAIATGISFFANSFLSNVADFSGWLAFISGLLGLIPGAQPLLGIAAILGTVATLATVGSAGLNGLLSVWSGIYAKMLYNRLPDQISSDNPQFKQYMLTLNEFGVNTKAFFGGLQSVGIRAATGGLLGAESSLLKGQVDTDAFTRGAVKGLGTNYDPTQGYKTGSKALLGDYGQKHNRAITLADKRQAAYSPIAIGGYGARVAGDKLKAKDEATNYQDKQRVKADHASGPVWYSKASLPTPGKTFVTQVEKGLSIVSKLVYVFKPIVALFQGVASLVGWIKGLFSSSKKQIAKQGQDPALGPTQADSVVGVAQDDSSSVMLASTDMEALLAQLTAEDSQVPLQPAAPERLHIG